MFTGHSDMTLTCVCTAFLLFVLTINDHCDGVQAVDVQGMVGAYTLILVMINIKKKCIHDFVESL